MSRIEIPVHLVGNIGNELKTDFHAVDVRLKDGRLFQKLVRGARYITGREEELNGEGYLPFVTGDIANVRPTARVFGSLWPFRSAVLGHNSTFGVLAKLGPKRPFAATSI